MKNNLGKLIFFIILNVTIYADGFTTDFKLSKNNPYVKESIILTVDVNQTDDSSVMLFKFDIKKSKDYIFNRIDIKTEDNYHNVKIKYIYKIYPLKSGDIDIGFNLIQMITTDEKLAYSFSGDRDNVRGLNKTDIPISLNPVTIKVKALPKDTQIVGDFRLDYKIKKDKVKAYEPIPIDVTIKGKGYLPLDLNLIPKSDKYSIFQEVKSNLYIVDYSLALSAKSSFKLDDIIINGFNPKLEKSYKLIIPKHQFSVTTPNISKLVDSVNNPELLSKELIDWEKVISFFKYLFIFILGFITAKLIDFNKISKIEESSFIDKIKNTKKDKELLKLLLAKDSIKYKKEIYLLDNLIYGDKKGSFSDIKNSLIIKERI